MEDVKILQRYHAVLKPHLAAFLISILFDIGMTILGLATPLFMRLLFDYAYPYRDLALLNQTIIAIVVIYFLYFFMSIASDYIQIYVHQETTAGLTSKVFQAIQKLPLNFHREKKLGDLIVRITDDVSKTTGMVSSILPTIVINGGKFLIILAIALYINPNLTILALLSIPLYLFEAKFYATRQARIESESIDADSAIFSSVQEKLVNIKTIKAFGQEQNETISFGHLLKRRYRIGVKERVLDIVRVFTNSITIQIWSMFLVWYLGYQVVMGMLSIGEVVALMLYFEQLGDPIRSFIDLFTEWKINLVSMHRLDEVFDTASEDYIDDNFHNVKIADGNIQTRNLSFSYESECEVLHNIDVKFPSHSVTAIVGSSGSGKTTLVDLLLRFFDPSKGIILVDGQNISEVKIHSLRGQIGIIAQDSTLFDGSIIDNILYGSEEMERGDAMRAAMMAGASDFIEGMPGGYDTEVGAEGCYLSGGQRQRITIARTLLRNPSIIIFDEATSALDAESEYKIHEVISRLRSTKTVIVIAHRLSTIKSADNIMVLEDGRFVEEGEFDQLIDKRGAFYKFYWRQFGGLAAFRQHLGMEFERTTRYGSKFCLAILELRKYREIENEDGTDAAEEFAEIIDFLIKKQIRLGDNCARLDGETILLLLPEINDEQLKQFFNRMRVLLPQDNDDNTRYPVNVDDLAFVGTRITHKGFKTPEDLLSELKKKADVLKKSMNYEIISEKDLLAGIDK
ncbi:MAG: ATP-binding cassette domain-containing protein [Deltaproteobacteria bacterium]|jgi:ABC-type bacteriocin/lantibiotic exporter with double-glycine peptidase domain/GGDEF domain-containing protein|nr:ATP-binding cassette domain-containing protein [Deltaproteobacteria bacterium]